MQTRRTILLTAVAAVIHALQAMHAIMARANNEFADSMVNWSVIHTSEADNAYWNLAIPSDDGSGRRGFIGSGLHI